MSLFTILSSIASYVFIKYPIPIVLGLIGFVPVGIIYKNITSWIQAKYGTPYPFSLLQSTGARSGILNPGLWSFIPASIINSPKSLISWLSSRDSTPALNIDKSKHTHQGCSMCGICSRFAAVLLIIGAITYFRRRRHNSQQITHNDIVPDDTTSNQDSTELTQQPEQSLEQVAPTDRRLPLKVTELLHRNSNNTYTCPECKKTCKPQGITRHVKSCAEEWCRTHGIYIIDN